MRWYRLEQRAPERVIERLLLAYDAAVQDLLAWPESGRVAEGVRALRLLNLRKPFQRRLIIYSHDREAVTVHRVVGAEQERDAVLEAIR